MTRDGSKTTLVAKKNNLMKLGQFCKTLSVKQHTWFFLKNPVSGVFLTLSLKKNMVFTNVPMAKSTKIILSKPASFQAATAKKLHITTSCGSTKTHQPTITQDASPKNSTNHASLQKQGSGPTFQEIWPPISTSFGTNTKTFTQNNFRKQRHLPYKVGPQKNSY